MRPKLCHVLLAALAFLWCCRFAEAEKSYQEIPVSKVPLKALNAARQEFFAVTFTEAELVTDEDGTQYYELEGVKDKKEYRVQVDPEGKVLKAGADDEFEEEKLERQLSGLPLKVKAAAERVKGGLTLTGYRTEKEYGRVVYEVEGLRDGTCYEAEVTEDGSVLEAEECD